MDGLNMKDHRESMAMLRRDIDKSLKPVENSVKFE